MYFSIFEKDNKEVATPGPKKAIKNVPGLVYQANVLDASVQKSLWNFLKGEKGWSTVTGRDAGRQVLQYGARFDYASKPYRLVDDVPALPTEFAPLLKTLPEVKQKWTQCIVNRYLPGEGISAHTDDPDLFGPVIACFSLGAPVTMEFSNVVEDKPVQVSLLVEPGSMYTMSDDARYKWKHAMPGKRTQRSERVSITLRSRA